MVSYKLLLTHSDIATVPPTPLFFLLKSLCKYRRLSTINYSRHNKSSTVSPAETFCSFLQLVLFQKIFFLRIANKDEGKKREGRKGCTRNEWLNSASAFTWGGRGKPKRSLWMPLAPNSNLYAFNSYMSTLRLFYYHTARLQKASPTEFLPVPLTSEALERVHAEGERG